MTTLKELFENSTPKRNLPEDIDDIYELFDDMAANSSDTLEEHLVLLENGEDEISIWKS